MVRSAGRAAAGGRLSGRSDLPIRHLGSGPALPPAIQVHALGVLLLPGGRIEAYLLDWLNLLVRWAHVIVGIAWIGASFYFIWLDNHLEASRDPKLAGELWAIHGGGFYNARKFKLAPEQLPATLHWFKWEAYWTWITGFALLVLVYYVHAELYLIDASVKIGRAHV